MKAVSISEAKNKLSALLRGLRGGDSVIIMDRGRPVAKLERVDLGADEPGAKLSTLVRRGLLSPGNGSPPSLIWETDPPRPKTRVSVGGRAPRGALHRPMRFWDGEEPTHWP